MFSLSSTFHSDSTLPTLQEQNHESNRASFPNHANLPFHGPVWRGLFGEIPIAGKIFSWKRGTQNILNQSLVLTNSYITPTSMGYRRLYPNDLIDEKGEPVTYDKKIGDCQWNAVWDYKHKGTITIGKNCLRPDAK